MIQAFPLVLEAYYLGPDASSKVGILTQKVHNSLIGIRCYVVSQYNFYSQMEKVPNTEFLLNGFIGIQQIDRQ